jgi:hypothetical protein
VSDEDGIRVLGVVTLNLIDAFALEVIIPAI